MNREYKNAPSEKIPRQLVGMEYWQRQAELLGKDVAREIDHGFEAYGYAETVPPMYRYLLCMSMLFVPMILLIAVLFCCDTDYPVVEPRQQEKVKSKKQ